MFVLLVCLGLQNEMDECEVSPGELFAGLGLVIVESRVPHLSPKGHVEGPHVPTALGFHGGHNKHVCSNNNFLVSIDSEISNLLRGEKGGGVESLFYLTTPLEHFNFHIIGYWTSSIWSL